MSDKQWYSVVLQETITREASIEVMAADDEEAEELAKRKILDNPEQWQEVHSEGIDASVVCSEE
jgi:hypothetical protein